MKMEDSSRRINKKVVNKYTGYAFMYAEYPNKNFWPKDFKEEDFKKSLVSFPTLETDVSPMLYIHSPYCRNLCLYCSCYKVVTKDYEKVKKHTEYLFEELDLFSRFFNENKINPSIELIHLGGGSPCYLKESEFDRLIKKIDKLSPIKNVKEFAMEIDPRRVDKERMLYYSEKGVNRISFGIQEFDLNVQKTINRIQPPELLENLLAPEVRKKFNNVSFDILYGLPNQTKESFRRTIEEVLRFSPDRIILLSFNYSPHIHKHQLAFKDKKIPDNALKTEIFFETSENLLKNGYLQLGLEHFVKPTDNLVKLWDKKKINWNMIGYTPGKGNRILGIGPSSESRISDYYSQNILSLGEYEKRVAQGRFPVLRSYKLTEEDRIRRDVINNLRSFFSLDYNDIEKKYDIEFKSFFEKEVNSLTDFAEDGLIELSDNGIKVTEQGKPFVSFVCMNFDSYYIKK